MRKGTRLPIAPDQHLDEVDIIVCIHNAYEDVQSCLNSVVAKTSQTYRLILVDDGSDAETRDYVKAFAEVKNATLIRHEKAKGYTLAANLGLQARRAPYCILLNSDTEVSTGWLDRLMDYIRRDTTVGIVGPLSNTASWQSVPSLAENGDWAQNPLPEHLSLEGMAQVVAKRAHRRGIPLGFLNGFCLLFRSKMLDEIGIFDEETFGAGYGEENDLCIRARKAGWKLLAADDCFVLHKQSKSYGEKRHELAKNAREALSRKHNADLDIKPFVRVCRNSFLLNRARSRILSNMEFAGSASDTLASKYKNKVIAFILPTRMVGGGANVILQEATEMQRLGITVYLINVEENRVGFDRYYGSTDVSTLYIANDTIDISDALQAYDV